jgi:hypothetical protein
MDHRENQFLKLVINNNNSGVNRLDFRDQIGINHNTIVHLAKQLGRVFGIYLYELDKKLYVDDKTCNKLLLFYKPPEAKLVKCYIQTNILTSDIIHQYIRQHNLKEPIEIVDSQKEIDNFPDKRKVSFFILPSEDQLDQRNRNFEVYIDQHKILQNRLRELAAYAPREISIEDFFTDLLNIWDNPVLHELDVFAEAAPQNLTLSQFLNDAQVADLFDMDRPFPTDLPNVDALLENNRFNDLFN